MRYLRMGLVSGLILAVIVGTGLGQVTPPRLLGLFVVPTDYPTIGAAISAADNGGTVVVLDRPEGAYDESIFIPYFSPPKDQPQLSKPIRILGVGASLNGNIHIACGNDVEIAGFQIQGEITACAQDLGDLIAAVKGWGPELAKLRGRLALRSNQITGDVRVIGLFGFNYTLDLTDNVITGGVRVEEQLDYWF